MRPIAGLPICQSAFAFLHLHGLLAAEAAEVSISIVAQIAFQLPHLITLGRYFFLTTLGDGIFLCLARRSNSSSASTVVRQGFLCDSVFSSFGTFVLLSRVTMASTSDKVICLLESILTLCHITVKSCLVVLASLYIIM